MMEKPQRNYSVGEYFMAELMSPLRHEYFAGEILVMPGGSLDHATIVTNVTTFFHAALRGSRWELFGSHMRISTPSGLYTYPDASIVCSPADIFRVEETDTIRNPVVLVEVLSEATCDYDRGQKFDLYRAIPALRDYLLIEQSRVEVEHRHMSDDEWTSRTVSGLDAKVRLTGVDLELPLALVYEQVEFS